MLFRSDALGIDLTLVDTAELALEPGTPPAPRSTDDPSEDLSLEEYFQRFVLQNQDHMSETELARKLGVSRKCLWERRQRFGMPRRKAGNEDPGSGRRSA